MLIVIGSFIMGIAGNMIASELYDSSPSLARWLISQAAECLPQHERSRRDEEWLADNNDCPGKVGKIVHALGYFVACYRMSQLKARHAVPVQMPIPQTSENPTVYRILVWVADNLDPVTRRFAIEKDMQHCNSVLNELEVPKENRIVEIRTISSSSPLLIGAAAMSNIWNASIEI